jgi:hypothetical protein
MPRPVPVRVLLDRAHPSLTPVAPQIRSPTTSVAPQALYDAARTLLNGVAANPAIVAASIPISASAATFAKAANEVRTSP